MSRFVLLTGFFRNKPFIAALNRSNNFLCKEHFQLSVEIRAAFRWLYFAVISLENSRHPRHQSDAN